MKISAIILAAGKSTRMKSSLSKLLHKVAEKEILHYVIDAVKPITNNIITVIREDDQEIKNFVNELDENIEFAIQEQTGTGGATKSALKYIDKTDASLIICGDTPLVTTDTLKKLIDKLGEGYDLALIGFNTCSENQYGRLIVRDDQLLKIVEFKEATKEQREISLCNSAIMLIRNEYLSKYIQEIKNNNSKQEYYLTDIVEILSKNNLKLSYIICSEEEVLGVNDKVDLAKSESIMQVKLRRKMLESGVTLIDPNNVFFSHDTVIEEDVIIHPFVVIKKGVKIAKNVEIKSFCHLEGVEIKESAVIGPYARIRPKSIIESEVHIGNFVEIKNSTIASSSKISHLSYIGDTIMGSKCNIGAGTITCNYDGKKKSQTIIGNGVFIGSNTSLIAPLSIEDNALIAAGSVINKHIPAKSLAITRAELVIKHNWKR